MEKVRFVTGLLVLMSIFPLGSCHRASTVPQEGLPSNTSASVREEIRRLDSFDPVERMHAAHELGRMGERAAPAVPFLIVALKDNERLAVRSPGKEPLPSSVAEAAMLALVNIGAPAVEPLISCLGNSNPGVRMLAAEALGRIGDPRTIDPLIRTLQSDADALVQATAVDALRKKDDPRAMEALVLAGRHENWMVRSLAGRAVEEAEKSAGAGGSAVPGEVLPEPETPGAETGRDDQAGLPEGPDRQIGVQGPERGVPEEEVKEEAAKELAAEDLGEGVHIVGSGDTLYSLGRRYGVSWQALMALNGLRDPTELRVGQVLKLPAQAGRAGRPSTDGEVLYAVQQGDNLYEIGLLYGMSWKLIAERNGIPDADQIYVGQVLRIPARGGEGSP